MKAPGVVIVIILFLVVVFNLLSVMFSADVPWWVKTLTVCYILSKILWAGSKD